MLYASMYVGMYVCVHDALLRHIQYICMPVCMYVCTYECELLKSLFEYRIKLIFVYFLQKDERKLLSSTRERNGRCFEVCLPSTVICILHTTCTMYVFIYVCICMYVCT